MIAKPHSDAIKRVILENMIRLADDHREHCKGEECNISLSLIPMLLEMAGITVSTELFARFA